MAGNGIESTSYSQLTQKPAATSKRVSRIDQLTNLAKKMSEAAGSRKLASKPQ